jgi:hypothetical protein
MRRIFIALIFVLACAFAYIVVRWDGGVTKAVAGRYGALIEKTYRDQDSEPLCIYAGPFPLELRNKFKRCDHCEDLVAAGLLTKETVEEDKFSFERFDLTESGSAHYEEEADPELLARVKRRLEARGEKREPDADALANPRLCFGKERFHHIAEALGPFHLGADTYVSVKVVAEVKDPSPLLWDPKLAPLKLTIPPKPKPGEPVLQLPRIVTFRMMPGDRAEIDNMRYGAWVNEK